MNEIERRSPQDRARQERRFSRVQMSRTLRDSTPILSAQIVWPNHELSRINDLSYKGFAAERPGIFACRLDLRVTLSVRLGWLAPFAVEARLAWCSQSAVGLEVNSLPPEGHLAMANYLSAPLSGRGLREVPRKWVSARETFHFWYQGPDDTNVFAWLRSDYQIERVRVELAGQSLDLQRGQILESCRGQAIGAGIWLEQRALLLLSQMDKTPLPMEEFLRSLGARSGV